MIDIDFGDNTRDNVKTTTSTQETIEQPKQQDEPVDISNPTNTDTKTEDKKDEGNKTETHELEAGTVLEFEGVEYKVDDKGNVVDKEGNIYKKAEEVKDWMSSLDTTDENDLTELNINNIQKEVGYDIVDENNNPVEFENSLKGVKAYIEAVKEQETRNIVQGTMNKFYNDNPLVKQFVDYVTLTGSPRGFGDIPDRRGIKLDAENKDQHIAIIKMAAQEFGNSGINDNYIKYLETTGGLYDEAKLQLKALQDKDVAVRKQIEEQAAAARVQEEKELNEYFEEVNNVIRSRKLGQFTLPENVTVERNGRKLTLNLDDFYKYVSQRSVVDEESGNKITAYQRDLHNQSNKNLLEKELLDAYLMFIGGSYADLINMIAKEDNVKKLVLKSKENKNKNGITIKKPNKQNDSVIDNIIFE
jgi:hypothetical protein